MNIRPWFIGLLAFTWLAGCGDAEEQKAKYLERGKTYFAEENFEKARVEFKNVLQIDPKDVEARYMLARIQEQKQNFRAAFKNYARVIIVLGCVVFLPSQNRNNQDRIRLATNWISCRVNQRNVEVLVWASWP